jgi:hypothetical protein
VNERDTRALVWGGLVLITLCGALSGMLEALLVPLYLGSTPFPLTIVLAVATNIALPRMARALRPTTAAAIAPLAAWLIVVVGFGVLARPEGDVILPGGPLQWVTYAMLLGGATAGMFTVALSGVPARRPRTDDTVRN